MYVHETFSHRKNAVLLSFVLEELINIAMISKFLLKT